MFHGSQYSRSKRDGHISLCILTENMSTFDVSQQILYIQINMLTNKKVN